MALSDQDGTDEPRMLVIRPQDLRKEQGSYLGALVKRVQSNALVKIDAHSKLWGGLERLNMMAEDLGKTAVRPPWHFEQLKKIADSQLDAYMDKIDELHSSVFFYDDIMQQVKSHIENLPDPNTGIRKDVVEDKDLVGAIIGFCIHTTYLNAASWYLLRLQLDILADNSITDKNVRNQLHQSRPVRELYIEMFDLADRVVEMERYRFGQACAADPYFSGYFERVDTADGGRLTFKKQRAGDAFTNLVDFLVVQLALPGEAPWSVHQLLAMLHEAFADDMKEEKKLSEQVNVALGELSVRLLIIN